MSESVVLRRPFESAAGIPCAMVLTVSFALSSVTMLGCHRHQWSRFHQLSACIGAPGPHDFAVRGLDDRLTQGRVHRIPLPTFVTIAKRPSSRPRDARKGACDLPDGTSAIACDMLARRANRAWLPRASCPSGKNGRARKSPPSFRGVASATNPESGFDASHRPGMTVGPKPTPIADRARPSARLRPAR